MSKAKRNRKGRDQSSSKSKSDADKAAAEDSTISSADEAALLRIIENNKGNRLSVAGAYAWGYGTLAIAQLEDDKPEWLDDTDPLDIILLGIIHPNRFHDAFEFGNIRTAWLRKLRGTSHWADIGRFVCEAVTLSHKNAVPVHDTSVLTQLPTRLEAVGLDQRKLPTILHPETALADARIAHGPAANLMLTPPTNEAIRQAETFMTQLEAPPTGQHRCVDMLLDGIALIDHIGYPARTKTVTLLLALYVALVASNEEPEPDDLYDRALAWATGLHDESPLTQIVDTIISAAIQDLDHVTTVGHLFGIPEFTQIVKSEDRRWHSEPGTDFVPIAFEFGCSRVRTRDGISVHLDPVTVKAFKNQYQRFEERFGRAPGPDDHVFTDEDVEILATETEDMLKAADIHPAWIAAYMHYNAPLPLPDGTFNSEEDRSDWQAAIDQYLQLHPDEAVPNYKIELTKLRHALALTTIIHSIDDSDLAIQIITLLDNPNTRKNDQVRPVFEFLEAHKPILLDQFANKISIQKNALKQAEMWAGSTMVERIQDYVDTRDFDDEEIDISALFIISTSYFQKLRKKHKRTAKS